MAETDQGQGEGQGDERRRKDARTALRFSTGVGQAGQSFAAEVLNLSQGGLLLRTATPLAIAQPLEIVLPQRGTVAARVAWSNDGIYGINFDRPLNAEDIGAADRLVDAGGNGSAAEGEQPRGVDAETFGQRIRRLRLHRALSMRELASRIGVSKPTLWKWEGDQVRPRHEAMAALAAELDVRELELIYGAPGELDAASRNRTLAEVVRDSRRRIAEAAGVADERVAIVIDWNVD